MVDSDTHLKADAGRCVGGNVLHTPFCQHYAAFPASYGLPHRATLPCTRQRKKLSKYCVEIAFGNLYLHDGIISCIYSLEHVTSLGRSFHPMWDQAPLHALHLYGRSSISMLARAVCRFLELIVIEVASCATSDSQDHRVSSPRGDIVATLRVIILFVLPGANWLVHLSFDILTYFWTSPRERISDPRISLRIGDIPMRRQLTDRTSLKGSSVAVVDRCCEEGKSVRYDVPARGAASKTVATYAIQRPCQSYYTNYLCRLRRDSPVVVGEATGICISSTCTHLPLPSTVSSTFGSSQPHLPSLSRYEASPLHTHPLSPSDSASKKSGQRFTSEPEEQEVPSALLTQALCSTTKQCARCGTSVMLVKTMNRGGDLLRCIQPCTLLLGKLHFGHHSGRIQ